MDKNTLKQILLEQKDDINRLFAKKIIARDIKMPPVTDLIDVIIGVRRCGKSTLAHQILKGTEYGYVNFDDERLIGITAGDLNDFLEVLKEINPSTVHIFLDEIQNIEGWELFVNRLQRSGYKMVVSGSNSKLLSRELATHLTGRHISVELYPFSFKEFLAYRDIKIGENDLLVTEKRALIKSQLEAYMELGGLPEAINNDGGRIYLRELYDKLVTRDIVQRYGIRYVEDLKGVALYAVSNFGARLTYHKVRRNFDIKSVHTAKKYISYLEDAYLIFQVANFSFKLKESIKGPRKIYCIDTGLINSLVPRTNVDGGRLMENSVFLELKRRGLNVYYYAEPSFEVDFLIKDGLEVKELLQVSFSLADEDTKKRELKALQKASEKVGCNRLTVITWDEEGEELSGGKKIQIVPMWKWLLA